MSLVYTRLLLGVTSATAGTSTAVPAGKRWIVRCIDVCREDAGGTAQRCVIARSGFAIFASFLLSGQYSVGHWEGSQVLDAGQSLGFVPLGGTWDVMVTGYEFSLT